jgi:4-diphosphocytidyl-2-C-methyl-D-erythritol kinase
MSTLTLQAPAKLNLSLRVLGRRDDGFHEIDTLMLRLPGLADVLVFEASPVFSFHCDDPLLPADEGNLVVKAVRAYEAAVGAACGFSITLRKNIPHGAGLGGGSSDAAATLYGLDRLHDGSLGAKRLGDLAAAIGSDVPFFLGESAARCRGRGEKIEAVPSPAPHRVLLLKPAFGVATPEAYRRWQESRELPGVLYAAQAVGEMELCNDLERPVFEKHRFLAELKQWLLARDECAAALLAGSGSTVFAILHEGADGDALAKCARDELDPGLWHWCGVTGP